MAKNSLHSDHINMLDKIWLDTVGLNIGMGFVKGVCGDRRLPMMPSVVTLMDEFADVEDAYTDEDVIFSYEGKKYAAGYSAYRYGSVVQADRSFHRMGSEDYKLLMLAALVQLTPQDRRRTFYEPEALVLVAPLSSYDNDKETIKNALAGKYEVGVYKRGGLYKTIEFIIRREALRIIQEGRGTLATLTITKEGLTHDPDMFTSSEVMYGVVTPGTRTTELLGYRKLVLDPQKSDSGNVGMVNAWAHIQKWAQKECNYRLSDYDADIALQKGYFWFGNEKVELTDVKLAALTLAANGVNNLIASLWQGGKDAYKLVVAGGGGDGFFPYIQERYPHAILVDDPVYSEAQGAFLYGIFKLLSESGIYKLYR